jgi:hypothetical protein
LVWPGSGLKVTTIAIFILYQWIVVNHAFAAAADHADDSVPPFILTLRHSIDLTLPHQRRTQEKRCAKYRILSKMTRQALAKPRPGQMRLRSHLARLAAWPWSGPGFG